MDSPPCSSETQEDILSKLDTRKVSDNEQAPLFGHCHSPSCWSGTRFVREEVEGS